MPGKHGGHYYWHYFSLSSSEPYTSDGSEILHLLLIHKNKRPMEKSEESLEKGIIKLINTGIQLRFWYK